MKLTDALNLLEIKSSTIKLDEVKKAYKAASKKFHPDINPSGLYMMQMINSAYEFLCEQSYPICQDEDYSNSYPSELSEAINAIINIPYINIEVCGIWVWVSGKTKENKDTLKSARFKYSGNKKMWYFRPETDKKRYFGKGSSIDEIRGKYGHKNIHRNQKPSFYLPTSA